MMGSGFANDVLRRYGVDAFWPRMTFVAPEVDAIDDLCRDICDDDRWYGYREDSEVEDWKEKKNDKVREYLHTGSLFTVPASDW